MFRERPRALYRPADWVFPSAGDPSRPLRIPTTRRVFSHAKSRSGVEKIGGIHGLRHAYATHQLERGLPVHELQRLLGHGRVQSTLRVPSQPIGATPSPGCFYE